MENLFGWRKPLYVITTSLFTCEFPPLLTRCFPLRTFILNNSLGGKKGLGLDLHLPNLLKINRHAP